MRADNRRHRVTAGVVLLTTLVGCQQQHDVQNRLQREILSTANRAAAAGQWHAYWECWTEAGQDELLVQNSALLKAAAQRNPQDAEAIEAWLRSCGLRVSDIQGVSRVTTDGDPSIVEAARKLKRRLQEGGRTEEEFFVGAAQWLEEARGDETVEASK